MAVRVLFAHETQATLLVGEVLLVVNLQHDVRHDAAGGEFADDAVVVLPEREVQPVVFGRGDFTGPRRQRRRAVVVVAGFLGAPAGVVREDIEQDVIEPVGGDAIEETLHGGHGGIDGVERPEPVAFVREQEKPRAILEDEVMRVVGVDAQRAVGVGRERAGAREGGGAAVEVREVRVRDERPGAGLRRGDAHLPPAVAIVETRAAGRARGRTVADAVVRERRDELAAVQDDRAVDPSAALGPKSHAGLGTCSRPHWPKSPSESRALRRRDPGGAR